MFYDDNQNIYSRVCTFPITETPFPLSVNCRNTLQIHNAAYKYYKGEPVEPSDMRGEEIKYEIANGIENQALKISNIIVQLIKLEKILPNDITILIADSIHKKNYFSALRSCTFPKPVQIFEDGKNDSNSILITTISRFKGLESQVIFLWGLDHIDLFSIRDRLYVGISRAKSLLYIVGNSKSCSELH